MPSIALKSLLPLRILPGSRPLVDNTLTPYQGDVLDRLDALVDAAQTGIVLVVVVGIIVVFLLAFIAVTQLRA